MRNIFDFYSQAENQLTHALFSTLKNEPKLLGDFVRKICGVRGVKTKGLHLSVQQYPFARAYTEKEIKTRSIPDAWIYNNDGFALVFEAKISASVTRSQLTRHENTAKRQGFDNARFYTITAVPNTHCPDRWQNIRWHDIYTWLRKHERAHPFAGQAANYFEILEARMSEKKQLESGNLTTFTGFPSYEDGYSYLLAKNTLKKAMGKLHTDKDLIKKVYVDPKGKRRGTIKGTNETVVWDFLPIRYERGRHFADSLHLTLGINERAVEPMLTIPDNIIKTNRKNKITDLGIVDFKEYCKKILNNMEPILRKNPDAQPILRGFQRHEAVSNSTLITDTFIEVDMRTAFQDYNAPKNLKYQPQWLNVIYDVFCNKTSNYQMQIGMYFSYKKCERLQNADALELVKSSWLACKPLIDLCNPDLKKTKK